MRRSWSRSNNSDIEEVINMRNQYTSTFEQDHPCRAQIIRCKADRDTDLPLLAQEQAHAPVLF